MSCPIGRYELVGKDGQKVPSYISMNADFSIAVEEDIGNEDSLFIKASNLFGG